MSLGSICANVLSETGWQALTGIAANTDATAQQIFAIANTELKQLSKAFTWPHLEQEYLFNTVVDQASYTWPEDFRVAIFGSVFDTTEYYKVRGSINIEDWNMLKYGLLNQISRETFRLGYSGTEPTIELSPPPSSVRALVALYSSKYYAQDIAGTRKEKYEADSDVSVIPEDLIELGVKWRFRRAKGLDFSAELSEYNSTCKTQFARFRGSSEIAVGHRAPYHDELYSGYVPQNGFGV